VQLDLDVATRGAWSILTVRGDLDLATGPLLRQRIVGLLAEGRRDLGVDLTALDFIDSVGLGLLVAALKRVRALDGRMFVAADTDRIRSVFEITGLGAVMGLVDSVDVGVGASS
jgi:anti-sigma B factor antagonist